jgi:hypothetical protein
LDPAAAADLVPPDGALLDAGGEFKCPACGAVQPLPAGGVYVIYDRAERQVRFVGRSSNVVRRLEWWQRPGGRYADRTRFRGVQLATTETFPDVAWFAAADEKG